MSKLKIIQVNKFFYAKGGADKYFLTLIDKLSELDIEVVPFAMADPRNIDSSWNRYFSENIDYHQPKNVWKMALRLIWNREAAKKFGQLLDETKPDLVHAHNIYHQLSPAILLEAKKRKIPVIMTLHDYKLICPNYLMFSHGKPCNKCLKGNYLHCLTSNCYNSYPRSALAVLETYLHNKVWHTYQNNVDLFISPSEYLKQMMISAGWPADKIRVLINPAPTYKETSDGQNLLYFGRLAVEKGVDVLLRALKLTNEKLDIVGTGPEETNLKLLTKELGLADRVAFHGNQAGENLEEFKRIAKAVILPSVWAENMSLVLLESLAYGKLIIASASGGTPELIKDGETGWLFSPGNFQELAQKIKELNQLSPEKRKIMTGLIKDKIVPLELKNHLNSLIDIYKQVKNR
ncbi:MAG: glycosyltransferase [Candidatus Falkowbacteria bacterium]